MSLPDKCPHLLIFHEETICNCPSTPIDYCCGPDFLCAADFGPWGEWRSCSREVAIWAQVVVFNQEIGCDYDALWFSEIIEELLDAVGWSP